MKDLNSVKQKKATTVQGRSGKSLKAERKILNRWTEYYSELYNYKATGDLSVLNCHLTDTEDDQPILRKEVKAAVQQLKKGKSAGVDNIAAELAQPHLILHHTSYFIEHTNLLQVVKNIIRNHISEQ